MSTQQFDPAQYKSGQRRDWNNAAYGWKRWWPTIETGAQVVSDRLVELAQIEPGHRVLDIATGIGEPAVTAARQVGASGRVTATDQSMDMLDIARERATDLGLQNLEFREMDAEALDFPDQSFDAVVCRWGLMFLPDVAGALGQVHRLLTPGGRFATTVWDVPENVPMLSVPMGVVRQMLDAPPPPPGAPGVFSLADTAALETAFADAGFADVRSGKITVSFNVSSSDEFVQMMRDCAPPVNALLADKPADLQQQVWAAIGDAAGKFADADGGVSMANDCIFVVGQRA